MPNILPALLASALVLRLIIWQFLRGKEFFFVEEFSNAAVSLLIFITSLLWAAQKKAVRKSGLDLPLLLLFGAASASLLHTLDFPSTLNAVLNLAAQLVFFYMLSDVLDTPERVRRALVLLCGLAFIACAYGVVEFFYLCMRPLLSDNDPLQKTNIGLYYVLVHRRAVSFLGWPNTLAGFLLLFLPLAIVLPFYLKKAWQKSTAIGALGIVLMCFLFTFSFLGWLSFFLGTLMVMPFLWHGLGIKAWPQEQKRKIALGLLVLCVLFLWVILRKNFIMSLTPRLVYYKAAFVQFAKDSLWGSGLDTFGIICRSLVQSKTDLTAYVHNSYLQTWIETGIVGFAGLVWLVIMVFHRAKAAIIDSAQKDHLLKTAIAWGLVLFLVDNLFSFTILKPNAALFWWAMLAVFCSMAKLIPGPQVGINSSSQKFLKGGLVCILLLMCMVEFRIFTGYVLYAQAQSTEQAGSSYSEVEHLLSKAQSMDPWSSYLPAAKGELFVKANGQQKREVFLQQAQTDYLEAVRRSPNVYANYLALSGIYLLLGDPEHQKVFSQKAKELSPAEFASDSEMFRN